MSTEVTKPKTVDESIIDHLKSNFGSIMTEEQLALIFEKSIETILFQKNYEQDNSGNYARSIEKPPLVVQALADVLEPKVVKFFENYVKENPDAIKEAIEKHFENPGEMISRAFGGWIENMFQGFQYSMITSLEQHFVKKDNTY